MHLRLRRLDERRYETLITRSDGVTWLVKGVGHMGALPHDLTHFVVERALGIQQGFWGTVAEGGVFGSLTHVKGRRRPHAARRSAELLKRNQKVLTETEILVGIFDQALAERLQPDSPVLRMRLDRYSWTPPGHQPRAVTDEQIEAACGGLEQMLLSWKELRVGESLELEWPEAR